MFIMQLETLCGGHIQAFDKRAFLRYTKGVYRHRKQSRVFVVFKQL